MRLRRKVFVLFMGLSLVFSFGMAQEPVSKGKVAGAATLSLVVGFGSGFYVLDNVRVGASYLTVDVIFSLLGISLTVFGNSLGDSRLMFAGYGILGVVGFVRIIELIHTCVYAVKKVPKAVRTSRAEIYNNYNLSKVSYIKRFLPDLSFTPKGGGIGYTLRL